MQAFTQETAPQGPLRAPPPPPPLPPPLLRCADSEPRMRLRSGKRTCAHAKERRAYTSKAYREKAQTLHL